MSENEINARRIIEQLVELPTDWQKRIQYFVEDAAIIANSRADAALPLDRAPA